jgi:hypothetical protein
MLKKLIEKPFNSLGYNIERQVNSSPIDLTNDGSTHPLRAVHRSGANSVIFNVPIRKCRHMEQLCFPLVGGGQSISPYVKTLFSYKNTGHSDYAGSYLEKYYENVIPTAASDIMGLYDCYFSTCEPLEALWFWTTISPKARAAKRKKSIAHENRKYGLEQSHIDGCSYWGRVTREKGELEMKRLIKIYENIKRHGITLDKYKYNNVKVGILMWGEDWRVIQAGQGQHRMAAFAANNYKNVPVQLNLNVGTGGILRYEESEFWPIVQNGYLSENEARLFFERIFHGIAPRIVQDWWKR